MISVRGDDKLRAVVLVMRQLETPIRSEIGRRTRDVVGPLWKTLVAGAAESPRDKAVLNTGVRLKAGNPPVLVAASSRRRLSGGLIPADQWAPVEFGANRDDVETYASTSKKGKRYSLTRHTAKQLPPRYRKGRIVHPAFAELAPRAVALWVQTVVRTIMDAFDGAAR